MATILNEEFVDDFQNKLNKKLIQFLKNKKRVYKLVHMPFKVRLLERGLFAIGKIGKNLN